MGNYVSASEPLPTETFSQEALSEESLLSVRLQEIINILENADGQIPDSITADDMQLFLDQGGALVEPILKNIWAHSVPVEMPTNNSPQPTSTNNMSRGSYRHDAKTGTTIYVDGSEFNHPVPDGQTSDGKILTEPNTPRTRAYPIDWTEANPQNYANTRSTCAITIKYPGDSTTHFGSGFLISGNTVATAAHVITNNGVYPSYVLVTPSHRETTPMAPYGTALGTEYEAGSGWIHFEDSDDDWGVIRMNKSFSIECMRLMKPGDNIGGWWVRTQGYPSDIMRLTGGNIKSASDRNLQAANIVYHGMSGGPMIEERDYIIGIISLSYGDNGSKIVKLDDWLYNKLTSYESMP